MLSQHTSTWTILLLFSWAIPSLLASTIQKTLSGSGQGNFYVVLHSESEQPKPVLLKGPVIALYDIEKQCFCGTLLQDKTRNLFTLSMIDSLGQFKTRLVPTQELEAFFAQNSHLIGCQTPAYKTARKNKLYGLAALAAAGLLFTAHGLYMAKARYQELTAKPGCNLKAEIIKDLTHCIALILMYLGVDALAGNKGNRLFLAALGTTYSYHGGERAIMPLIIGPLLAVPAGTLFCKHFWSEGYKNPKEVVKYTKIALKIEE